MKKQTKKSVVKKQPTAGKATRQGHLPFQPGELLTRHFKGADIEVKVLKDGFLYAGKEYKSLTAVAVSITGYSVSGPAFFKVK